jgi:DNA-binding NarL/FixJ family response regulator
VTVADTVRDTPGLSKHLAEDASTSVVRCPAISGEVASICLQLTPCVLIADASFLAQINLADEFMITIDSGRSVKILIVVDEDDPRFCLKLLRLGCAGTVRRGVPSAVFQRAIHAVAEGELWASRKVTATLVSELLSDDRPRTLTARERQILDLIAKGHKNREIADSLFISRETVRWHARSIYSKLGVSDRDSAIEYALDTAPVIHTKPVVRAEVPKSRRKRLF